MSERRIARRVADEVREQDAARDLGIDVFNDGRVLGWCRVCPKRVADVRAKGRNHAQQSGFLGASTEDVADWFAAHVASDLHQYYLNPEW